MGEKALKRPPLVAEKLPKFDFFLEFTLCEPGMQTENIKELSSLRLWSPTPHMFLQLPG